MSSPARSWSRMRQATASRYCSRKTESPSASLKARPRSPSVNHWGRGYEPVIVVGRILSRVATSIGAKLPEKEGLMRRRAFLVAMGAAALGVAGGLLAATGYAIAPYLEQNKIPTVYPVMAPDDITQRKPVRWIVRTSFAGSQVTHPLGDYASKRLGLRRMATISMDYAFGWESNGGFQRVFEELGGKVVQRIWTPLNVQDYAPYLASF